MACEVFERRMPAQPDSIPVLRHALVEFARTRGASEGAVRAIALAASEAITNVVMHAYVDAEPGPVTVAAKPRSNGQIVVNVCDQGTGIRPRHDSPGLGLGIPLMTQMADDLRVANRPDKPGAVVSMRFLLAANEG